MISLEVSTHTTHRYIPRSKAKYTQHLFNLRHRATLFGPGVTKPGLSDRAKFLLAMRYWSRWSRQTRSDLCASKCNYFTNCLIFHHFMVNFFFVFCDGLIVHKMPLKKHHTKIKSVFFGYLCPFWVKHFGGVDHVDCCCCGGDLDHGCMYK